MMSLAGPAMMSPASPASPMRVPQVRLVLRIHLLTRRSLGVTSSAPDRMILRSLSSKRVRLRTRSIRKSKSRTSSSTSNPKPTRSRAWAVPRSSSKMSTGSGTAWSISLMLSPTSSAPHTRTAGRSPSTIRSSKRAGLYAVAVARRTLATSSFSSTSLALTITRLLI